MFKVGPDFSLRDKRYFEINEVEITRVDYSIIKQSEYSICSFSIAMETDSEGGAEDAGGVS